jgi:type VI protein secretion system component VasF
MALSMDEQRILSEIASQLSDNDPKLAQHLSTFGRARRRRRIKVAVAVVVVAAVLATVLTAAIVILVS